MVVVLGSFQEVCGVIGSHVGGVAGRGGHRLLKGRVVHPGQHQDDVPAGGILDVNVEGGNGGLRQAGGQSDDPRANNKTAILRIIKPPILTFLLILQLTCH